MPATFDSFGVKFLYPENWVELEGQEDEIGTTLELPTGGFLSINQIDQPRDPMSLIDEVADALSGEYDELERETVQLEGAGQDELAADFRFYYLDLVVVSRVAVIPNESRQLLVQFQAESRDFEANEKVVDAILVQIRSH